MSRVATRPLAIDRDDCTWYTPYYCEENVYRLCRSVREVAPDTAADVVFVSNKARQAPLWAQRSGPPNDAMPVIWDYHVIMIMPIKPALKPAQAAPATAAAAAATAYVYDLDSVLPFPAAFGEYVARALRTDAAARLPAQYQRNFRVVPASLFLEHFASDRSHMLNKDGSWTAEPPIAPCIATEASTMNLSEYVSMETNLDSATFGKVYTEAEFVAKYAQPPAPAES